jgi:CHAT domain-containing protein
MRQAAWLVFAAIFWGMTFFQPTSAVAADRRTPTDSYYQYFGPFYDGEYKDALRGFQSESRGSIKSAQSRWIDSICYETMCGECWYQVGSFDKALEHYNNALQLFVRFSDWMLKVRFTETSVRPASVGARKAVPWGVSTRPSKLGYYRDELIAQGQVNISDTIQHGGVVQQANLFKITPHEIVRTTTLALRRRAELLGPAAKYDPLSAELVAAFNRPVGPPNHWSECWGDLQRGLALVAGGREGQGIGYIKRAELAAGEFDHPMTCVVLLELGRMAMIHGEYQAAEKLLAEATFAAVNYSDWGVLEEAFRYAAITHLISNKKGFFTPLEPALLWAKQKNLRQLRASLALSAAENYLALGNNRQATLMLDEARATIGRREMGAGRIGARLNYLSALAEYQRGRIAEGNAALAGAMGYMRHGSIRLFHISLSDQLFTAGGLTPRAAMDLYADVLRDPKAEDWTLDPMETLATLITPQPLPMEHWFEAALSRGEAKEINTAVEIAERTKRRRFYNSLDLGGRLETLRWVLEAPENRVPHSALLQRQDILARYPEYQQLKRQSAAILESLGKQPLAPTTAEALAEQNRRLGELAAAAARQEAILREIALRREPAEMVFPPLLTVPELQKSLPNGHAVLAFFATSRRMYGFLLNNERAASWQIGNPPLLLRQMQAMLREMGNFGSNHEMTLKDLGEDKWKQSARQVLETLLKGSPADLSQSFDELAIVPDGALWYLPFEALQVNVDGKPVSLISRFRIRYLPTISLCAPQGLGANPTGNTAVVLGKLHARDEDGAVRAAFERLAAAVPGAVALPSPPPAPSSVYGALFHRLIVLDDIAPDESAPFGWSPAPLDRGKTGGTLADWLLLPWGGPDLIVLPGFHTPAEDALKRISRDAPGNDLFLEVCGLMSTGARTLLIARWRTGGQTAYDLVREFAQELPFTEPADAWQRAVMLTIDSRVDLQKEPRVKKSAGGETPKGEHPFFWAGYMLVDSCAAAAKKPDADKPADPVIQPPPPAK